jgi:hypothetical protein
MKKTIIYLFLSIVSFSICAQNYTQTVKGKIQDTDTQATLPGAHIVLIGSNPIIGTSSDIDGNFKLNMVPIGRHSLKITFMGYEEVVLSEILVGSGREVVLNVVMKESLASIDEVRVVANKDKSEPLNQMATVSATQITVESTSRIAAGSTRYSILISMGSEKPSRALRRLNAPRLSCASSSAFETPGTARR